MKIPPKARMFMPKKARMFELQANPIRRTRISGARMMKARIKKYHGAVLSSACLVRFHPVG